MEQKTLVMYEISQKQKYIFRTNKLIENIGASMIIRQLTEKPHELFESEGFPFPKETEQYIKIVGGGNAVYIFDNEHTALTFAKHLTAETLRHFPGVELFLVTRKNINWDSDLLYDPKNNQIKRGILSEMRSTLAEKKNKRVTAVQQLSWGVHQICTDSGLPANMKRHDKDSGKKVVCAKELVVKERMGRPTRDVEFEKRFLPGTSLPGSEIQKYTLLNQGHLEKVFGEEQNKDIKSYVAVVHIDGNAMGVKVNEFLDQHFASNDDYVEEYKQFAEKIDNAYTKAFRRTVQHLMNEYDHWAEKIYGKQEKKVGAKMEYVVPLRPIVASGDDVCFITYGQLGLETARIFIQYLQQQVITINYKKHSFEACAGVAVVKQKFPFWLAYELSEALCSNAKKRLKADSVIWKKHKLGRDQAPFDTSLIDWHIIKRGDLQLDLQLARQSIFQNRDGSYLINRPYYLQRNGDKIHHDASYTRAFLPGMRMIEKNEAEDENFHPRSKWKALLDVYHQGSEAVEQWKIQNQFDIEPNQLFLPLSNSFEVYGLQQDNVRQNVVAYFYDALEIMDYFIPLGEVNVNEPYCYNRD